MVWEKKKKKIFVAYPSSMNTRDRLVDVGHSGTLGGASKRLRESRCNSCKRERSKGGDGSKGAHC